MNIGIDIRPIMHQKISGVGNYVYNAISRILALDRENKYYLLSSGFREFSIPSDWQLPHVKHIHVKIPNKLFNALLLFKMGRPLDKYFPVPLDLFWLPNLHFYKFSNDIKVIFTVHDLSFLHSDSFYSWRRRLWHYLIKVNRLIYKSYKIIAVSHNTKRDIIRRFSVPADKITTIYPGINSVEMNESLARKYTANLDLPEKYFMFLGTLEPRKNVPSIIQAFDRYHKDYPDTGLVLIGNLGWVYRKLLREIKARPYIKYLGFVDSPLKDAIYYLSEGLIWPSFYEGFGFPPLEITYYHKPVIVSFKTSLPEIMGKQALYVDPYNSAEIYFLLKALREDIKLKDNLVASAKDFPLTDWTKQAQKIIDLFNQCG